MPPATHFMLLCKSLLAVLVLAAVSVANGLPWQRSPEFEEQRFTTKAEPNIRIHVNAPLDEAVRTHRATRLIIYTLPNGNTIEQTLGCRMVEGLDWHYDIQHVAAQLRLLRATMPDERIVLVCAEAAGLSWPNWRRREPNANAKISHLVEEWRQRFGTGDCRVTLTGHSGGGSFLFGLIEANDDIPASIDRIAFLDANYSFDDALHTEKLKRWLIGDDSRRLIVLAYDDREITYQGKKVVGPTGGTFRATRRMGDALGKHFELSESIREPFLETRGLDNRIHFYVHPNRQNKILHTALVGEMNGLAHIATLGTPHEERWGTFGGPRAYVKWVQAEPEDASSEPEDRRQGAANTARPLVSGSDVPLAARIPPRPADAVGGRQFIESLEGLSLEEREAAILRETTRGNIPDFLREFKIVSIRGTDSGGDGTKEIAASLAVMADYLAIGSGDDFVRMPMRPQTAQRIADAFGCTLPTRKIVDAVDAAAEIHLAPHPLTHDREAVATFFEHQQIIEKQREGRAVGLLITGIKKDLVLSPRIFERPERLALYGWRKLDGQPIQPLTIVHWNRYVDYSHGVRLVGNAIEVGGRQKKLTEVLADPNGCSLVSDEGPMNPPRYPLEE